MQTSIPPSLGSFSQHQFPTPVESFAWLNDSIPEWLEKLSTLTRQVSSKQNEFENLSIAAMDNLPSRLSKRHTGSTESLRPKDDNNESTPISSEIQASIPTNTAPTTPASPAPKLEVNPHNRRLFQEYRDAARLKRKSTSIHSGASGPAKFRIRASMVIYYDSDIQSGFESMVRCLASARNTLKKGKNATSYKARIATLAEGNGLLDSTAISAKPVRNLPVPRSHENSEPHSSMDSLSLEQFDVIDKELEVAQTLCEIGAHQFLRDASSVDELAGVQARLETCLKLSRECYEIVKAEEDAKKADETRPEQEDMSIAIDRQLDSPSNGPIISEPKTYGDSAIGIDIESDHEDELSVHLPGSEIEIDIPDPTIEIDIPDPTIDINIPDPIVEIDTPAIEVEIDIPRDPDDIVSTSLTEKPEFMYSHQDSGIGLVEVDCESDTEPFHVDLSAIRRTR